MTEHRVNPLQWLSTKFASLNHSHSEYLTNHQDISGKEDKSNKSSSITTDTGSTTKYTTIKAVEDYAQPKGNYLTSHQDISGKLDKAQTSYKGKNVVVDGTSGNITFEDKNNHTHSQYLTEHQDITGKENISNKISDIGNFTNALNEYPNVRAVKDYVSGELNSFANNNELGLGTVAFSNEYEDLYNLPQLGDLAYENDVDLSGHDLDELSDNTNLLFSGSYDDLTNKPTIPSKTSDLTNDSGFLTSHQSLSGYLQTSDVKDNLTSTDTNKPLSANQGKELKTLVDGKANSTHTHTVSQITNFPSIPTKTSDLTNDSQFIRIDEADKECIPSFNGNETVINKYFDTNDEVKFHYSRDGQDYTGYIQIGEDENFCIIIGVEGEYSNEVILIDNLSSDVHYVPFDNVTDTNSFDISIKVELDPTDLQNNCGQLDEQWHYTITVTLDEKQEDIFNSSFIITQDDELDLFLSRNVVHKIIQNTNSSITDLTFSTSGVYVEKGDMTNNSLNIDSLLADMIDYGMDNDSEW